MQTAMVLQSTAISVGKKHYVTGIVIALMCAVSVLYMRSQWAKAPATNALEGVSQNKVVEKVSQGLIRHRDDPVEYKNLEPCLFKTRQQVIQSVCSIQEGQNNELELNKRKETLNIVVDNDHKIMLCQQYKVDSEGLSQYFNGLKRENFPSSLELPIYDFQKTSVESLAQIKGFYKLENVDPDTVAARYQNYSKVMFMKHPLQRIIPLNKHVPHGADQTNEQLATFINEVIQDSPDLDHFPIVRRCRPCVVKYDFIMKMETFNFDIARMNKDLGFISNDENQAAVLESKDVKSNYKYDPVLERLLDHNPELFEKLSRMYGVDMSMFGYSWENHHSDCGTEKDTCC